MQGNGHGVVASKMALGMLVPMSLEQVRGLRQGRVKHEGKTTRIWLQPSHCNVISGFWNWYYPEMILTYLNISYNALSASGPWASFAPHSL